MTEPIAYSNSQLIPQSALSLPVVDSGFVLGAAVTEQLRTFRGCIFQEGAHRERLTESLRFVFGEVPVDMEQLARAARQVVEHNHRLLAEGDDLGVSVFVTPGLYAAYAGGESGEPTVGVHTYPLPFALWAEKYDTGQHLRTVSVRQVPAACWPPQLKCRSRMHYFLADREATRLEKGARALLLDLDGLVTETSTANLVAHFAGNELVFVSRTKTLRGISEGYVEQLAADLNLTVRDEDITVEQLSRAREVMLTSTPLCMLPVTAIDGKPIGEGRPGPLFRRLIDAWSQSVGVDVVTQARRFAKRGGSC